MRPPPAFQRAIVVAVCLVATASLVPPAMAAGSVSATVPRLRPIPVRPDARTPRDLGLLYRDLVPGVAGHRCPSSAFEIRRGPRVLGCTHGPDPAPRGVDVTTAVSVASLRARAAPTPRVGAIPCSGNGVAGDRVQVIYGHSGGKDRFKQIAPLIRTWAAEANAAYNASAAETGGTRQIRFVTSKGCVLSVRDVRFDASGIGSIYGTIDYLHRHGFRAKNRKYLVYMDTNLYCGVGELAYDDAPSSALNDNDNGTFPGMVARVDAGCWGYGAEMLNGSVEAHELTHTLGAVQRTAPRHSKAGHCVDEYDLMCYTDGGGVKMRWVCPFTHQQLLDCHHDDYFSTHAPKGSYLAKHWNAAKSSWLLPSAHPANDDLKKAQPVALGTGSYVGSVVKGSAQNGEPGIAGQPARRSIWYQLKTKSGARQLSLDTNGTKLDTVLGVYTGKAVGALTLVAENDDTADVPGQTWSSLSIPTDPSTRYWIKVDVKGGQVGPTYLHVAYGSSAVPVITDISPRSGPIGTVITVTFSSLPSGAAFATWVDGFDAAVTGFPPGQLQIKVPKTTADPYATPVRPGAAGPVVVQFYFDGAGYAISSQNFKITKA